MAEAESPFASVPDPEAGPLPTPVTYEQQIAGVGAFAVGLQSRPAWIRWTVRVAVLAFVAVLLVAIVWAIVTA